MDENVINRTYSQNMREFMRSIVTYLLKDVTFVCDEGKSELYVSKAVLAACSEFISNLHEDGNALVIDVPEASVAEIDCLLEFIYYGTMTGVNQKNVNHKILRNVAKRLKIHCFEECIDEYLRPKADSDESDTESVANDSPNGSESKNQVKNETNVEKSRSVTDIASKLGIKINGKNLIINDFKGIFEQSDLKKVELILMQDAAKSLNRVRKQEISLNHSRFNDADLTESQKDLLHVLDQSIYEVPMDQKQLFKMALQINSYTITASADSKIRALNNTISLALAYISDEMSKQLQKREEFSESLLVRLQKIYSKMESGKSKDKIRWGGLDIATRYDPYNDLLTSEETVNLKQLDQKIKLKKTSGINACETFEMSIELNQSTKVSGVANAKLKAANLAVLAAIRKINSVPELKDVWPGFVIEEIQQATTKQPVPRKPLLDRLQKIYATMESAKSKEKRQWGHLNIPTRYDPYENLLTPEEKTSLIELDKKIKLKKTTGVSGRETFEMGIELDKSKKVSAVANTKLKAANKTVLAAIETIRKTPHLKSKWPALLK